MVRVSGLAHWVTAMSQAIDAPDDTKTVSAWAAIRGVAPDTLRGWCRTAGLSPKRSLDLARLLRAVYLARRRSCAAGRFLSVADHHTLERLLKAGGLAHTASLLALDEVLSLQTLITDSEAVDELRKTLRERGANFDS